jgi:hypothetical protein
MREKWEFPVYWYPSSIEKIAGGFRMAVSMSHSRPADYEWPTAFKSTSEPIAGRITWWLEHWMRDKYGPTS